MPKIIRAGQTADCRLKINPKNLAEPFEKSMTLELADTSKTRLTIPVIRRFHGPVGHGYFPGRDRRDPSGGGKQEPEPT